MHLNKSCINIKGKRHNRVHPGQFATQQGNPFYPAGMSAAGWSTLVFTLPRRKIAWVHPTKATFFQNCTLILAMCPVVSGNETLPPVISPAEITFRSHQRTPKYRSSRAKHTTTTDLPPTAATLHVHIDSSRKSSLRGVHPGDFPSRQGENERRPISCAHSSWIKGSTLLCRKLTRVHPAVSFPLISMLVSI